MATVHTVKTATAASMTRHDRPSVRSASFWLLFIAALLAAWMLTFFVQLLNDSIHRGESLRAQQNVQLQPLAGRAQAVTVKTTAEGMLASQR